MARATSVWQGLIAVGGLLVLTGCGDLVSSMRHAPGYSGPMVISFLSYAGTPGPIHVRLLNNPFGDANLAGLVAAESDKAVPVPVKFTADAAAAGRPDWRLVVIFNPSAGASVGDACERPATLTATAAVSGTEMMVSFCNDAKLIAGVRATTGTITAATDPRLKSLVRYAIGDLFSPGNTDSTPDNEIFTGQIRRPRAWSRHSFGG